MKRLICKKTLFSVLFATAATFGVSAQKLSNGSLDFLKGQTEINIVIDYSEVTLDKINKRNFDRNPELYEGWQEKFESIDANTPNFIRELNIALSDKGSRLQAGNFPDSEYKATVKILNIHTGSFAGPFSDEPDMDIEVEFSKNGVVFAKITKINAEGNSFAATINSRISSIMEETGEKLGKFLAKKIK